ncbi:MAG: hypothetical protein DRJ03_18485 [Chloroflexi bacterium]|nr:MAG: hypothetical protein DRJ03_18485 [Chloroflexota bacterium]
MISLRERLEALKPDKMVELVDRIKEESEGSDYYQLIIIELEDLLVDYNNQLMSMTDHNSINLMVGRLQGLNVIKSLINSKWRTDDAR